LRIKEKEVPLSNFLTTQFSIGWIFLPEIARNAPEQGLKRGFIKVSLPVNLPFTSLEPWH
jgi:hypothetical protein